MDLLVPSHPFMVLVADYVLSLERLSFHYWTTHTEVEPNTRIKDGRLSKTKDFLLIKIPR